MNSVPRIAVVNQSTMLSNDHVGSWVPALQRQLTRDFAPIWGVDGVVISIGASQVQPFHWVLGVFDSADQANALGYHDLTPQGKPVMKVFVKESIAAGVEPSSVASHEMLETGADPFLESVAVLDNGDGTGTVYPIEVADPVEGDRYQIYGIWVSNFVTPWWFGGQRPAGAKYDFMGKLSGPLMMTAGGYFSSQDITKTGLQAWKQTFADKRAKRLAVVFSGRARQ